MRLHLVRHGQTPSNVHMALDSKPPGPPLTEEGRRQAAELAAALATEPVVAVYASTAVRAQQTAAPVAEAHGLPVRVVEGVHEVFVGDLEGRNDRPALERFFAVYAAWADGDLDVSMPGGETGRQVLDRFVAVVARIRAEHPDGAVVLVSHGAAVRLVAHQLANVAAELTKHALVPNTGQVVLEADHASPTGWRCLEWTGVHLA
ncbi:histidine phosphatase family protein [Gandjariella thermophila]|uniref:histidine phosphatase family protein n=1 Tax=Gandjariella thermophila TaxID=1931992 RepID=UPI0010F95994|nr:histidine phosphatase family protein [Gandjariella thermophila]